jgi:hypothetical protein
MEFGRSPLLCGPYGYWGYPLMGFGGWGPARSYNSGYYPYYNPYYVTPVNQTIVCTIPISSAATNLASDRAWPRSPIPGPRRRRRKAPISTPPAAFRNGEYAAGSPASMGP